MIETASKRSTSRNRQSAFVARGEGIERRDRHPAPDEVCEIQCRLRRLRVTWRRQRPRRSRRTLGFLAPAHPRRGDRRRRDRSARTKGEDNDEQHTAQQQADHGRGSDPPRVLSTPENPTTSRAEFRLDGIRGRV